jgi:CheY-like chemotaxis protein
MIAEKKLNSVLLIDDDEPTTFMYQMVLEESGCTSHIEIAHGADDALNFFRNANKNEKYPDLIFLDINMPRMDGWEFLQQLKELNVDKKKNTIIVMLSTSLNPDEEIRAKHIAEVSAFRHKPLTVGMVWEIVGKYFQ